MDTCETAYLSNEGKYTIFQYQNDIIRFRAPYSLERYIDVKEWDNGYLVVMAKYTHSSIPVEEYISVDSVLDKLYYDTKNYLKNIKGFVLDMNDLKKIANEADMIISGYAYTRDGDFIRVLNFNNMKSAAVFNKDCSMIETNMCDIELRIATDYLKNNMEYMDYVKIKDA